MTEVWVTIVALALVTIAIKGIGPFLLGTHEIPSRLLPVVVLLPSALVTALVVSAVVERTDSGMIVDVAQVVGIAVAAVALLLRLPLVVVLIVAVVVTAGFRALT
ncbi:MAG TPA: AzlD domain-containing protein [Actinomycetes bacterium]|nr:AzlD domain-containing protein [Actinomycetes bacterium]